MGSNTCLEADKWQMGGFNASYATTRFRPLRFAW
jgi:hypothetical protein